MNKSVSFVLPVWLVNDHLLDLTFKTLKSLTDSEGIEQSELIIVDNGSPIGGDILIKIPNLYVRGQSNLGYPWAVNQGIKISAGDFICVPNNDIRVSPNWYGVAKEILEDKEVASVHFRMIPYEEPFNYGNETWKQGKERWCSSSFFVIKGEVIDKVGLYDENYGVFGYDDYDFWYRVRKAGFKTAYTNKACYQHLDSSTANLLDQTERQKSVEKNREYYKQKHGEYPDVQFAQMFPEQMQVPWKPFP